MDTNKMRDAFEVALAKQAADDGFAKPSLRRNKNNGDYVDPFERAAWWGWQASREAVVVDWPDQHTYTAPDCAGAAILDCRVAFGKAMRVTP